MVKLSSDLIASKMVALVEHGAPRKWHGLPSAPYMGQQLAYIRDDPNLAFI